VEKTEGGKGIGRDMTLNNRAKNYHMIYQKKGKEKFPAISFYNLVTKKISASWLN